MAPRTVAHLLGLCNLVAGALLLWHPRSLLGAMDGAGTPAARLLASCVGILLIAVGGGALRVPPAATRSYLWIFGVAVKVAAAVLWSTAAWATGSGALWAGAAGDAAIAMLVAVALRGKPSGA